MQIQSSLCTLNTQQYYKDMEPIVYPGFGKPIDCMPERENRFPTLLEDDWRASTLTIRELFMLWFTEQITNKPNWQTKVFDDTILCKWRAEVDHVDWFKAVGYHSGSPCSDAMWEYVCPPSLPVFRRCPNKHLPRTPNSEC